MRDDTFFALERRDNLRIDLFEFDYRGDAMPIYHFTVRRSGRSFTDQDGLVFDNMNDAWEEATKAAGEMVKDLDGELVAGTFCSVEVQDEFFISIRTLNITVAGPKR